MKSQRGSLAIEIFIVVCIIAIIAAIALPILVESTIAARVSRFKEAFGVTLPISTEYRNASLTDEQRLILNPLVLKRLSELCNADNDPLQSTVTDPASVQQRLNDMTDRAQKCERAKAVAKREGIVPSTPQ